MSILESIVSVNENRLRIINLRNKNIKYKIKLCWVKAHIGYIGNKIENYLAKAALNKNCTLNKNCIDIYFYPSKRYIRNPLKQKYLTTWLNDWYNSMKGRITWNYIPIISHLKIISDFYLNQVTAGQGIFLIFRYERFGKT